MSNSVIVSRQRILSLWFRRLPTDRIERQWRNAAKDEAARKSNARTGANALVVVGKRENAEVLLAVNDVAEALGLTPGLVLAQARAMHPGIAVMQAALEEDARLLDALADWCQRYTPLIALDGADGITLDIGGCAHLFGGEQALLDDLVSRLTRFGLTVRAAIADTIGAAWAAARYSDAALIPSGAESALLGPLPLSALRLPSETVTVMRRVGLKQVGDILELPRPPLTARFGGLLWQQLDRALGKEREPLSPRLPVPPYFTEQRFAEPIAREDDVLAVIQCLAARLRRMLETRGEGARRIELALFRTDGAVSRVQVGTSRPVRDASEIRALFVERLAALADPLDPGFGYDLARLAVLVSAPAPDEQIGLGDSEDAADLGHLVDRLTARFGRRRVVRLIAQDSHCPELNSIRTPVQGNKDVASGWESFRRFRTEAELSPRPLRLLTKPEPIEAVAPLPDGPPLRFRWRRALHEIARADGPERIENAWWDEAGGLTRDYFYVEDLKGRRFWLFRAGLYRDATELRWFMHGLFA